MHKNQKKLSKKKESKITLKHHKKNIEVSEKVPFQAIEEKSKI